MSTSLLTDLYELTMIQAAREAGVAQRHCIFEVFTRSLPEGRRYGVFTGSGRILEALSEFRFEEEDLDHLESLGMFSNDLLDFLRSYRFEGTIHAYEEGELFFPTSPVLTVEGTFEQCVLLETVILSILNHDSAISSVGSRMVAAAGGRPCIEMGSRRVHEHAAVAAARAAAIVGFHATSNLEASRRYGIKAVGTSAHAFTLLFDSEADAFRAQVASLGTGTSLLVDTFDVAEAVRTAVETAGPSLGGIRVDSGNLVDTAREVRAQLDDLGATSTTITATSDLDEYSVFRLREAPVDSYGIGTRLVTGGDHPAQGFVYKLVERENSEGVMTPVAKRSSNKATLAGAKRAWRLLDENGAARGEYIASRRDDAPEQAARELLVPLVVDGAAVHTEPASALIAPARAAHERAVAELVAADPSIATGQDGAQALEVTYSPALTQRA